MSAGSPVLLPGTRVTDNELHQAIWNTLYNPTLFQSMTERGLDPFGLGVSGTKAEHLADLDHSMQPLKYPAWKDLPPNRKQFYISKASAANARYRDFWVSFFEPISTDITLVSPMLDVLSFAWPSGAEPRELGFCSDIVANGWLSLINHLEHLDLETCNRLFDHLEAPYWWSSPTGPGFEVWGPVTGYRTLLGHAVVSLNFISAFASRICKPSLREEQIKELLRMADLMLQFQSDGIRKRIAEIYAIIFRHPFPVSARTQIMQSTCIEHSDTTLLLLPHLVRACKTEQVQVDDDMIPPELPELSGDRGVLAFLYLLFAREDVSPTPEDQEWLDSYVSFSRPRATGSIRTDQSFCFGCFGRATHKCSKCKAVTYCSQNCQAAEWKAGHKVVCKAMAP